MDLCKQFPKVSIKFLKIDTQKEFKDFPTRMHFSIDMYTRFLIPRLEPGIDRAIYSDVDVIFNGDIAELFREDLNGFPLAAVPYTFGYLNPDKEQIINFHERLGLPSYHKYFESGLLILDCKKWREKDLTGQLIKKVKECAGKILTPDQDIFNIVFANNYQPLDNKYIVTPGRTYVMLKHAETKKSVLNPFIYHFTGAKKPWDTPEIEFAEYFWKYAKKTTFYNHLLGNLRRRITIENNQSVERKFLILSPKKFYLKYWLKTNLFLLKMRDRFSPKRARA
jgi:lipopolysaccharide biosynthesis glycosyltransferase